LACPRRNARRIDSPIASYPSSGPNEGGAQKEQQVQKFILVVEDDPNLLETICLHLHYAGYATHGVANGLQAAAACLKTTPDLIISDVRMPHMDGFEMIATLRSEPGMKDIPVIFLTGDKSGYEHGKDLGAVEYLIKPFHAQALLDAVERLFSAKG
jgi:CheY-like chemotaxis protein